MSKSSSSLQTSTGEPRLEWHFCSDSTRCKTQLVSGVWAFCLIAKVVKALAFCAEQNSHNCKSKTKPFVRCAESKKEMTVLFSEMRKSPQTYCAHRNMQDKNRKTEKHGNRSSSTLWGDHCWLTSAWFVHLRHPPAHMAQLQF